MSYSHAVMQSSSLAVRQTCPLEPYPILFYNSVLAQASACALSNTILQPTIISTITTTTTLDNLILSLYIRLLNQPAYRIRIKLRIPLRHQVPVKHIPGHHT